MRSENKQTFKPNLTSTPSYSLSPCKMSVSLAEPLMSKHDYERWSSNLSIGDSHDDIDSKSYYIKLNSSTGCAISKALARKSMLWAKDSLERLPIKLTLENVGVITVFVALIMPKALTYALIYPIFRLVFGTLYPAYASYKAVRTKNVKEYVKWMMYWIVFALFTCAETFTDVFFSFWFPFYYEIKIILVLWLLSPATKGSSILYRRFVHPALCRREAEIDDALARATEQGYSAVLQLGTKGVNYATTVLMQTAIKGGGGLVQQLRKSYSLSDLTGEKEDENRNTEESPDEVDLEEPRRRETRGRRGYSPRRTQSSSNRMEMYFSEVDVEVRQSRSKEPVGSLTNIKSSEDISSGYSSGEALHSQRSSIASEQHLVRTASVGARNRTKPRSTTKKSPEVEQVEEEAELIENNEQLFPFNLLPKLTSTQALELISFFSKHKEQINTIHQQTFSDSDDEDSSTLKDLSCEKKEEPKSINSVIDDKTKEENKMETVLSSVVDVRIEEEKPEKQLELNKMIIDTSKINTDLCSDKLDELKELLHTANQTVATIVSSQENISQTDSSSSDSGLTVIERDSNLLEIKSSPNISRSNSDYNISERAGKYHKKPAPKAPESDIPKEDEDEEEEKPLKATLVIKTGLVKSFTNSEEPVKRRKKTNAKTAARESFNKLLTIPKNIFHNAFHKDKDEDGKSICSDKSSRSGSYEKIDVTNILLNKKDEGDTYISLRSDSLDCDTEKESKVQDNTKETIQKEETLV